MDKLVDNPTCSGQRGILVCRAEPRYLIRRAPDRLDYACLAHVGQLVKARLRGERSITVERLR